MNWRQAQQSRRRRAVVSVSPETVKSHVASLLSKLQLPNRTALVAHAVKLGLIDTEDG